MIEIGRAQWHLVNSSGTYFVEVTFANGCTGQSAALLHQLVSVTELSSNSIFVYPNPASEQVNIEFVNFYSQIELKLVDQLGRILLERNYSNVNKIKLDISSFKAGVYHVILTDNKGFSQKTKITKVN